MTIDLVPTYNAVDSWAERLSETAELAGIVATTDFVPSSLRNKPAAITAAILTGRELGIGPMTALANIHVINGRPGMSAVLMRQLVLAAGHEIRYDTATDSRCVVRGRRRGEEEWTQVTFTAEQAHKARINLGPYPEDKLVARATARLCRRVFADALGGMPYLAEEFEDEPPTNAPMSQRRTAQRRRTLKAVEAPEPQETTVPVVESTPVGTPEVDEPPLDDEPEPDPREPLEEGDDEPELDDFPDPSVPASREQIVAIAAGLAELGIRARDDRIKTAAILSGRSELVSTNNLTKADASAVLDTLARLKASDDPRGNLRALVTITGPISRHAVWQKLGELGLAGEE